jgi:nitrile hydratase subunit beta
VNGIHDMGGMHHNMGPIQHAAAEPVFHEVWEGRMYAIDKSLRAIGKWNIDAWRHQIELIPSVDYLRMTYYERWLEANERLLVIHGLATPTELATGRPESATTKAVPALSVEAAARSLGRGIPSSRDPELPPQFKVGQHVKARNINPAGHTRLARYARGKIGTVMIDHGVYSFPDTNALYQGQKRQHVYSIRFKARELWGEGASPRDTVMADMWEDYLEFA